jgi:hypothetical protein
MGHRAATADPCTRRLSVMAQRSRATRDEAILDLSLGGGHVRPLQGSGNIQVRSPGGPRGPDLWRLQAWLRDEGVGEVLIPDVAPILQLAGRPTWLLVTAVPGVFLALGGSGLTGQWLCQRHT